MATLAEEWDKATPITQSDWDKATPIANEGVNDLSVRKMTPGPESISTAPPKWVGYAKTGLEMLGLAGGGALGGPPGAGIGYAAARQVNQLLPSTPSRPADKLDFEKALGTTLSDTEYQDILKGGPQWKGLYEKMGLNPQTPVEKAIGKAGEVGMDVATGMALEGGTRAAAPYLPKILPMYARGRTPGGEEVANIARREGVRLPAADITGSTAQSGITSAVQKLPQSAHTMQKEAVNALGQFADYTDRTLGKLGGSVVPQEAGSLAKESVGKPLSRHIESQFPEGQLSPLLHGQATQEAIATGENAAKTTGGGLYSQAAEAAQGAPLTFDKVGTAIEKVQGSDRYKLLTDSGKREVDNFINLIKKRTIPETGEIAVPTGGGATVPMQISKGGGKGFIDEAALEGVAKEGNVITDFTGGEGFRRTLGDKVFSKSVKGTDAYGPMHDIYKAYEEDMSASAKAHGSEVFEANKSARDFWAKNVFGIYGAPGEKNFLTKLRDASPEQVVQILKKASTDDLNLLVKAVPKDALPQIQNGVVASLVNEGSAKSVMGETLYNGPQIAKAINEMGEGRLSSLFSKDQVRYLRDLAQRGTQSAPLFRMSNGSAESALSRLKSAPETELSLIKSNLSPDEFLKYRQGFFTQMLEKNSSVSPITNETVYNGPQLYKDFFGKSGLGESRLRKLVTPEEFTALKEWLTVGNRMGSAWRLAGNPSGTAHQLYLIHMLGQLGAGVVSLGVGEYAREKRGTGTGAITAGALLSPYVVAKLLTSNLGRQFLVSGFPTAERAVSRALPAGIMGMRGLLGGKEPARLTRPSVEGNYEKELSNSKLAISQGAPADKVKAMFKARTGKEYPE